MVPELLDTLFIILRKQKLIFLHWYHHATVMAYVFYSYTEKTSHARWFMVMNFSVHSVMYSYYALKSLRFQIPKTASMLITSLQLLQMIVGCFITYMAFQYKKRGFICHVSEQNLQVSSIMYLSYAFLFSRFFRDTYFSPKNIDTNTDKEAKKE